MREIAQYEWWSSRFTHAQLDAVKAGARAVIILVASILTLWFLSLSLWRLWPVDYFHPNIVFATSAPLLQQDTSEQDGPTIDLAQITSWDLFGEIPIAEQNIDTLPPDKQIKATLTGVIYSSNPKVARAIVRMNNSKQQRYYRVNQPLEDTNAIVTAIELDRVTLSVDGKSQTLMLYEPKHKKEKGKVYIKAKRIIDKRSDASARAVAAKFRKQVTSDVSNLTQLVRFSAVRKGRDITGYKMIPRRNHKEFKSLGFRSGDIVTAVDNIPLTNLSNLQKVLGVIEKGGSLSFYIKRGSTTVELLVDSG